MTCRKSASSAGFTLVEMLAALTIMGMMAGLLLPNFQRWFSATEQRVNASALAIQLQNMHVRAALAGQDLFLTAESSSSDMADGKPMLTLPPGWRLVEGTQLRVRASGYCDDAYVDFQGPASGVRLFVRSPNCEVTRLNHGE